MSEFDKSKPYNSLPILPPTEDVETKKALQKTIKASQALGKLIGALSNLPNSIFLLIQSINYMIILISDLSLDSVR